MASYPPPLEDLPIFDVSVFTDSENAVLTSKEADLKYLRKNVPDTATAFETFESGIGTDSIVPETSTSTLSIGGGFLNSGSVNIEIGGAVVVKSNTNTIIDAQAGLIEIGPSQTDVSGIIEIGNTDNRAGEIRIGTGGFSTGDIEIGTNNNGAGAVVIGTGTGSISLGETQSSGNLRLGNYPLRTGDIEIGSGINLSGDITIGTGDDATGNIEIGSGTDLSGTVSIGKGIRLSGNIIIGSGNNATGNIEIGSGTNLSGDIKIGSGQNMDGDINIGTGNQKGGNINIGTGTLATCDINLGAGNTKINLGSGNTRIDVKGGLNLSSYYAPDANYLGYTLKSIFPGGASMPTSSTTSYGNLTLTLAGTYLINGTITTIPTGGGIQMRDCEATILNLNTNEILGRQTLIAYASAGATVASIYDWTANVTAVFVKTTNDLETIQIRMFVIYGGTGTLQRVNTGYQYNYTRIA
jgi:hypothetical protein